VHGLTGGATFGVTGANVSDVFGDLLDLIYEPFILKMNRVCCIEFCC
jgi:hypothetical protein